MNIKRKIFAVAVILVACLPVTAQNVAKEKFIFTPQWTAHAQFAGYYVAQEKGFYKAAGLDVDIVHPSVSQTAMNRLKNRESHATTLQLCQAMEITDNGIPLVNILQTSMIPRVFPPFPDRKDIDLYASMTPAKEVGGDLYDYFVQDERLYFCVGDVSGKGIPASMFMAITCNLFRMIAQQNRSPWEIATQMNSFLTRDNEQSMFVTMFIGMIDLRKGILEFCNCGHNAPILDGKFLEVKDTNQPLGLWECKAFKGEVIEDIRDKQLLIYTDGLNEAENMQQERLGDELLLQLMADTANQSSEQIINKLKAAVAKHRNGAEPNDDLTLLCLSIKTL